MTRILKSRKRRNRAYRLTIWSRQRCPLSPLQKFPRRNRLSSHPRKTRKNHMYSPSSKEWSWFLLFFLFLWYHLSLVTQFVIENFLNNQTSFIIYDVIYHNWRHSSFILSWSYKINSKKFWVRKKRSQSRNQWSKHQNPNVLHRQLKMRPIFQIQRQIDLVDHGLVSPVVLLVGLTTSAVAERDSPMKESIPANFSKRPIETFGLVRWVESTTTNSWTQSYAAFPTRLLGIIAREVKPSPGTVRLMTVVATRWVYFSISG